MWEGYVDVGQPSGPTASSPAGETYLWATPSCLAIGALCVGVAVDSFRNASGHGDVLSGLGFAVAGLLFVWLAVRAALGGVRADHRGVTITNVWSRHHVPWTALEDIDFRESGWDSGGDKAIEWVLQFVRSDGRPVSASFPRGDKSDDELGRHRRLLLGMCDHALGWSDDDPVTASAGKDADPIPINDGPTDLWEDKAQVVSLTRDRLKPAAVEVAAVIRTSDGRYLHRRVTCSGSDLSSGLRHLFAANPQRLTDGGRPSAPREVQDRSFDSAQTALEAAQRQEPAAQAEQWVNASSFAEFFEENVAEKVAPEAAQVGLLGSLVAGAAAVAIFAVVMVAAWFLPARLGLDDVDVQGNIIEGAFYFAIAGAGLTGVFVSKAFSKRNLARAAKR